MSRLRGGIASFCFIFTQFLLYIDASFTHRVIKLWYYAFRFEKDPCSTELSERSEVWTMISQELLLLALGVFVGSNLGILIMCVMAVAKRSDEQTPAAELGWRPKKDLVEL